MSHFTVMVIGEDPESQLEPYNENIKVDPYKRDDVSEEEKEEFVEYYKKEYPDRDFTGVSFEDMYAEFGKSWNTNRWKKDENGVWSDWSTYNPKSKWDWYSLGGRWTGFLKVKPGADGEVGEPGIMTDPAENGHVDQAYKCDIDFEGMRDEAGEEAKKRYEDLEEAFGGVIPKLKYTWKQIIENDPDVDIEEKREMYRNQDGIVKLMELQELKKVSHFVDFDDYQVTKEKYIQDARNNAIATFAMVKDGEWYERGEMGYWAIVFNEKDRDQWVEEMNKMIDSLPEDTLISVFDCHI